MRESLKSLSEKTLIPISVALGVAIGAMYLRTIELLGMANAQSISALEIEQKQDTEARVRILLELGRINSQLERLTDEPSRKRKPSRD